MNSGYDDHPFIADHYDDIPQYRTRPDVEFFVDAAKTFGSPVLEIGCGTGRVLIPTARAGLDVVGLDSSPQMLAVCTQRVAAEHKDVQNRIRLVEADMRNFDLRQQFTLATIPFRPFQHLLTVADQLSCLASIRRHLVVAGTLILDVFNPSLDFLVNRPVGAEVSDEPEYSTPDGRRIVPSFKIVKIDRFNQINDLELIYDVTHPDGTQVRHVHAFQLRYLFRFEAEHLLARSGFEVRHVYADYDKSPYGSKYPGELLIVARRTPE
jgi:SAM-dependent methyltransferase